MIPSSIAFLNGKGGCGKTSICANVAGLLANSDWRVLVIDLDKQANLALNFGYQHDPANDHGVGLVESLTLVSDTDMVVPLRDVRPGLDVIPGGQALQLLEASLWSSSFEPGLIANLSSTGVDQALAKMGASFDHLLLAKKLAPIAADYDLILIDAPPAGGPMTSLALGAVEGVVVPVNPDYGTLDGLGLLGPDFARARAAGNTALRLLGVALFQMPTAATRLRREMREAVEETLAGIAPVFENEIRLIPTAGLHQRRDARVSFEYEQAALNEFSDKLAALRSGDREALGAPSGGYSSSASGLAADYAGLTEEIIQSLQNGSEVAAA